MAPPFALAALRLSHRNHDAQGMVWGLCVPWKFRDAERRGRRARDHRFPPLCLGSEGCPGLVTTAAVAASWYPPLSAKHSTICTAAVAMPATRGTHGSGDCPCSGFWGFQWGWECREDLQLGAVGCQHPPGSALGRFGRAKRERHRVAVSSNSHLCHGLCPYRHVLDHVQGAVWRWAGWDLIQSIPCLGT